jgi:PHD/YefM family antitoxin component YafN of YafNO toxin-antitoxin module
MPHIIPIKELKNTATISKLVEESDEPIFVTKNGYGSMVMMSMEVYEKTFARQHAIDLINESIREMEESGKLHDGPTFIKEMKAKYGGK